ncbi:hypothetical protein FB45DRAFT_73801 [Roridomyces roridus]|uniref:F-box domain-containing protein n=1 Tax=Roridomyces roridus TaxID=1738132 RepID=A0AAD7BNY0_9AGAR|nr:hypothetical protein FB45DRAFT_73801 [Roridomyces roridus]
MESRPRFPPEPVDLIHSPVSSARRTDLVAFSLVCRDWLPFARANLTIRVYHNRLASFIATTQAPTSTLLSTTRRLRIYSDEFASGEAMWDIDIILPLLPKMPALRWLAVEKFHLKKPLPILPKLTELTLRRCQFPSLSRFVESISGHPLLRTLVFNKPTWKEVPSSRHRSAVPKSIDLDSLTLAFDKATPESQYIPVLLLLRARKLVLSDYRAPGCIIKYMRQLGAHLTHLHLWNPDVPWPIDLTHIPNLQHLEIDDAFVTVLRDPWQENPTRPLTAHALSASIHLQPLLQRVAPACQALHTLDTLTLNGGQKSVYPNGEHLRTVAFVTDFLHRVGLDSLRELRIVAPERVPHDQGLGATESLVRAFISRSTGLRVVGYAGERIVAESGITQ